MTTDSRREKFISLAEKRTNNALKHIRLIGNLSNKGNYSYAPKDAEKIYSALLSELKTMKARFDEGGTSQKPEFKL